ncbi:MAG TPA: hypothetical protein VK666_22255, partial [Chryseolinea sp.]|nr:hypothetical protein [Chryseolinea sp.]
LYADVSGYWSKDFDPSYYLTVASAGYMHVFSKFFSIMGGYDRYFYNMNDGDQYIPYKNTLSVTPIIELKPFMFSFNYAFYFGDAYVNRLMPGISVILQKRKFLGLDRISFSPSFYVLFGDETLTEIDFVPPRSLAEARMNKQLYGTFFSQVEKNSRVFGVMNYTISAPLMVTYKNWGFSFTYAYSIPKALPGEPLTLSESSYLMGSITYFIDLKRNKLAL